MVDYVSLTATAQRLITKNGRSVTLLKFDSTPEEAAKPWNGPSNPRGTPDAELPIDAVFVEPSAAVKLGLSLETDDLVKRSEQIMIVSPGVAADLSTYNEVLDDSEYWKITGIQVLKPASSVVLGFVGVAR